MKVYASGETSYVNTKRKISHKIFSIILENEFPALAKEFHSYIANEVDFIRDGISRVHVTKCRLARYEEGRVFKAVSSSKKIASSMIFPS